MIGIQEFTLKDVMIAPSRGKVSDYEPKWKVRNIKFK